MMSREASGAGMARSVSTQSCTEPYLLCDTLPLYPNSKPLYRITVSARYITWEVTSPDKPIGRRKGSLKGKRSSSRQSLGSDSDTSGARDSVVAKGGVFLHFEDIVGCDTMKGKIVTDTSAYITIYAYPHKKKIASKRTVRKRETLTLTFNQAENYEQNLQEANKWLKVLQCLVKRMPITNTDDLMQLQVPAQKKMLMFLNPKSGSGKSAQLFQQRIVPILAESGVPYEMRATEFEGHARETMQTLDVTQWCGVVAMSGDGLIHEIINGLMDRADWKDALKLPVGCLPCGSGNALACSIASYAGEPYLDKHVMHATFGLTRHIVRPMDLIAIDTSLGNRRYSFLSCCWGLFADVDIETEKYRNLGEARFTVGAVVRILGLRKYQGTVSFLPVHEYVPPAQRPKSLKRSQSEQPPVSPLNGLSRSQSVIPSTQSSAQDPQLRRVNSLEVDEPEVPAGPGMQGLERVSADNRATSSGDNPPPSSRQSSTESLDPDDVQSPLPPLDQPVPSSWTSLQGEFVTVAAIYLSHIGKDLLPAPDSQLADGVIYLVVIRSTIGRLRLISLMGDVQKGAAIEDPDVELIKVKAFRIEPVRRGPEDVMTMDGEKIEYGPLQGYVLPSRANVMVPNKGIFLQK